MKKLFCILLMLFTCLTPVYADSDYEENYYPLEYIETNGTNYIDTGVIPSTSRYSTSYIWQLEVEFTNYNGNRKIGYQGRNNLNLEKFAIGYSTEGGNPEFYYGIGTSSWKRTGIAITEGVHTITLSQSKFTVDGVTQSTGASWDVWTGGSPMTLLLGLSNKDYAPNYPDAPAGERIYGSKIWSNSSTLVRNFVPALRKSDLKPGLYDLVNGVFYVNKGTQDDFTYPTIYNVEIPSSLNLNNSDLISVNYTVDSGVIGISMASSNNFKLINSSDSIPYSVSATEWPTLSAEGAFNIEISKDTQTIPAYSGAYTDILTFTISPSGSGN